MSPLDRQIAIRKLSLPWYARLIAYDLAARANAQGRCFPLQTTLAKDNGVSVATVQRAVAHLREIKAIRVDYGPNRNATYTLTLAQDNSMPSHRGVDALSQRDISGTTEVEANAKPPAKPIKRFKPGTCNRCKRRPSLHWTGPCEECLNRADHYRRTVAQIT